MPYLDGVATFTDLSIEEIEEGLSLRAVCEDDGDFAKTAMSDKFNIHSFPETGMLQETDTGFTYKGSAEYVSTVLDAFEGLVKGKKKTLWSKSTDDANTKENKVFLSEEMMAMWPEI
jgi:hypothetical protein